MNKLKVFLRHFSVFRKVKTWLDKFIHTPPSTKLNITETFPFYSPNSAGDYNSKSFLTIQSINQVFPALQTLIKSELGHEIIVENITNFNKENSVVKSSNEIKEVFDFYGSDKSSTHDYHLLYGSILQNPHSINNIFEIGLGTNNKDVVSNMGVNGRPGASLRAFRDFCPNAQIFGADVDRRILFQDDRIKTFFIDQTNPKSFDDVLNKLNCEFDLVIDDGLHSPNANVMSLGFALKIIKVGGYAVIEDISHASIDLWKIVGTLLRDKYECHIYAAKRGNLFTVKRLL